MGSPRPTFRLCLQQKPHNRADAATSGTVDLTDALHVELEVKPCRPPVFRALYDRGGMTCRRQRESTRSARRRSGRRPPCRRPQTMHRASWQRWRFADRPIDQPRCGSACGRRAGERFEQVLRADGIAWCTSAGQARGVSREPACAHPSARAPGPQRPVARPTARGTRAQRRGAGRAAQRAGLAAEVSSIMVVRCAITGRLVSGSNGQRGRAACDEWALPRADRCRFGSSGDCAGRSRPTRTDAVA